jgi:ABC-type Na+ efflux pump permease subunit
MRDVAYFIQHIPGDMGAKVAAMSPGQALVYVMLGYMLAPLFLVMPLMFSTIISADAFAGERERKTLEALLYTSASDSELFMGKVAAGLVPSLIVSWLSFAGYTLVLNLAGNSLMEGFWFPLPAWYVLIFWITPALATLGIAATVLISLKVNTFMEAYQMSASLVVLVLAMMAGQMTGVLYFDIVTGLVLGAVVWLITALLIWIAVKRFRRTQLISRL